MGLAALLAGLWEAGLQPGFELDAKGRDGAAEHRVEADEHYQVDGEPRAEQMQDGVEGPFGQGSLPNDLARGLGEHSLFGWKTHGSPAGAHRLDNLVPDARFAGEGLVVRPLVLAPHLAGPC